jgi:hypothetical protein
MKQVVRSIAQKDTRITLAALIKEGACMPSLQRVAELEPNLDMDKERFIEFLKIHGFSASDINWVHEKFPSAPSGQYTTLDEAVKDIEINDNSVYATIINGNPYILHRQIDDKGYSFIRLSHYWIWNTVPDARSALAERLIASSGNEVYRFENEVEFCKWVLGISPSSEKDITGYAGTENIDRTARNRR